MVTYDYSDSRSLGLTLITELDECYRDRFGCDVVKDQSSFIVVCTVQSVWGRYEWCGQGPKQFYSCLYCAECLRKVWRSWTHLRLSARAWRWDRTQLCRRLTPPLRITLMALQSCLRMDNTASTGTDRVCWTDCGRRRRWRRVITAASVFRAATSPMSRVTYTYVPVSLVGYHLWA